MRAKPPALAMLPYRKPQLGRDYWLKDGAIPNAAEVSARSYARTDWNLGLPYKNETWPGMRASNALAHAELGLLEKWVKETTRAARLSQVETPEGARLDHNHLQLVAEGDSGPRPHTDSRRLCTYAAVLFLTPNPDEGAGTSFYRLRLPDGRLGGNTCPAPYATLREALPVTSLPLAAWKEDVAVPNVFNRLLLYRSDLVHSATRYFGRVHADKRLTAVFFWNVG